MNYQPEEDLQRRLQNLEAEIKSSGINDTQAEAPTPTTSSNKWNLYLERSRNWFNGLSTIKKLGVTGIVMLLTVWMLQTVFALVTSVITLAVLAGLVYLGYKFFIANSWKNKQ
ncbi:MULTISPECIES: hypothetical protein [unclassified Anabaena]|uniref:hypothetical protein n=1 Tax=unclassified Anabaena TaxID=2619674 RepID=UPI0014456785|nr:MULTISPECIES: hypothetical protein [unclassified Anabaena]MTJ08302.1 hypothetical protein [Anabaena sp. UHCC 0204]MTJ51598.1 hypothetical protein [Anabaena sp. UHCC 0253]